MKEFINRFRSLLDEKGMSPFQFEKAVGITRGVLSKKFNGKYDDFKLSNLQKIKTKYPNVDMNWLIRGEKLDGVDVPEADDADRTSQLLAIISSQLETIKAQTDKIYDLTKNKAGHF